MEVGNQAADSGQPTGNTGAPQAYNSIDDAIDAALQASEKVQAPVSKASAEEPQASVEEGAGDSPRTGEDAKAPAKDSASKAPEADAGNKTNAPNFEAPKHWPEADRKAFAAMSPEAQSIIKRLAKDLEGGFTRRSQELGDKAKYAEAVRGMLDDNTRQQIAATGMNEVQYIGWLNQCQQFATRDPVGYSKWVMQQLGVTPAHLGILPPQQPAPAQQPQQPASELDTLFQDPRYNELQTRLEQLQGKLSQREQAEQEWLRQQDAYRRYAEAQRTAELQGSINEFRSALDDNGQLKFPHFDHPAVRPMMAALLNDPNLASAARPYDRMEAVYKEAVWGIPELRKSLLEQEASRLAQAQIKAQETARAKAVTAIKPASGVVSNPAKPTNLDDIISNAMVQHGR